MIKYSISQIVKYQTIKADYCLNENENNCWPDNNPKWKHHNYTPEEYVSHCESMDLAAKQATKYWDLNLLEIDDSKVLIRLKENPEEWLAELDMKAGDIFVLMGEIVNAPGHIIALYVKQNKMISMAHSDMFELLPVDF